MTYRYRELEKQVCNLKLEKAGLVTQIEDLEDQIRTAEKSQVMIFMLYFQRKGFMFYSSTS